MKYSRTYIKQSGNGIVGHIYEHVIANSIISELTNQGFLHLLDYELDANTFDGIVAMEFRSNSYKVIRIINEIFVHATIKSDIVKTAIKQIEAEYQRKSEFDTKALNRELASLHEMPWTKSKMFPITAPITAKDAREYKTSIGGFGRSAKRDFKSHSFVYKIEDCPYELKTVAVYILQIIGLIQIDNFYAMLKDCYDSGDEWAEYQDVVGYVHTLTIAKDSKITEKMIAKQCDTIKALFQQPGVIKKIQKYIERDSFSQHPYFSMESMFAKSYQIMGTRYLRKQNTTTNIAALIEKIEYSLTK